MRYTYTPQMYAAICFVQVQCCFISTEAIRTIRDREPRTATSTFSQLLSSAFYSVPTWNFLVPSSGISPSTGGVKRSWRRVLCKHQHHGVWVKPEYVTAHKLRLISELAEIINLTNHFLKPKSYNHAAQYMNCAKTLSTEPSNIPLLSKSLQ